MTPTNDQRLIEIARLYYREGLSQQAIARRIGVSRPTVSLALKRSRERGIVEIRIREPDSPLPAYAEALERRFGLAEAVVVAPAADAGERRRLLGQAAAAVLDAVLRDGCRIGVAWGTTLFETVRQLRPRVLAGAEVVQLIGALGSANPRTDGFGLAHDLAERLGGTYRVIQAPALVRAARVRRLLLREPAVRDALRRASGAGLAVVGISSDRPRHSALVRAGYLSAQEAEALCRRGAVGHVCGWHFDARGRLLQTSANDRVIGIRPDALRRIPLVIGVAGGPEKAEAIGGALRAGFLDVLVTDADAARRVLEAEPTAERRATR